jgi:aminopeptidase N
MTAMPGTNLTRDEAAARSALLSVHRYDVDLDLRADGATFASRTTIRFACAEPGADTFLDLIAPRVESIELNGRALDPASVVADSRITLTDLAAENELRVVAACAYMNTGEGLHRFVDPTDSLTYLYTQFEVADARRVFATFEQPDLKAVFGLTVRAPQEWTVIGNAATPEPVPCADGGAEWAFADTPRMSTYLVALVAGPYHGVHDVYVGPDGEVPLGLWCRRSLARHLDSEDLFTVTKQGFAFFEAQFGYPYPFGKYDQLFVPEFNAGAMENVACVTHRDDYLFRSRQTASAYESRANTVLHEMAHMWFGDLVTMRWWDDLWLNESFAEWASHWASVAATKYTEAWLNFAGRKNWAYRADQLPSTHPVAADMVDLETVETNFDGITYAKGASALRQLVAWVGEKEFVAGLRPYFVDHAYGNAEFADLIHSLEASSGRDLSGWASLWLKTTGVNTLTPQTTVGDDGRYTSFAVVQTATADHPTLRPHRCAIGLFDLVDGALVRQGRLELDVVGENTEVPELVGRPAADVVLLNDDDLTYAKVRFDPASLSTVVGGIGTLAEPLVRSLCWTALWDMTRDAELAATDWVHAVIGGLPSETEIAAVQLLLRQGSAAIESYSAPANRDALRAVWTAALRSMLADAGPGTDRQLSIVRALAGSATTAADLDLVAGIYDGSTVPDALTVDADLRWSLVTALARGGRATDADIDAERERDATSAGSEHAATARAARPDAEAKARAWRDAVERDDVPNQTQVATIGGFAQPGQEELLRPYLQRYFDVAAEVWTTRTTKMAANILVGLFPRWAPAADSVAAATEWLSTTTASSGARRLVSEGRADAERARAAQELDAAGAV